MRKREFKIPFHFAAAGAIILLALFLLLGYIWKVLSASPFFSVRQVVVRNSGQSFDYLKGRNIFKIDLKGESKKALSGCPGCRKVRFLKVLPDCVIVDFVERRPVALAKFYKNYAIDREGVLFSPSGSVEEAGLPVIYGLEAKIFGPKSGVRYKRPEIDLALSIIREFNANKALNDFVLKRVDVSSLQSAKIFIFLPKREADYTRVVPQLSWSGFEVRVGEGSMRQKMMILGGLLTHSEKELSEIRYVDLRFNEPVIQFKEKP